MSFAWPRASGEVLAIKGLDTPRSSRSRELRRGGAAADALDMPSLPPQQWLQQGDGDGEPLSRMPTVGTIASCVCTTLLHGQRALLVGESDSTLPRLLRVMLEVSMRMATNDLAGAIMFKVRPARMRMTQAC